MIDFSPWLGANGFPGNLIKEDGSLEFGDSLQRLGMIRQYEKYNNVTIINQDYDGQISMILKQEPVRHWDGGSPDDSWRDYWPGRIGSMSRDNAFPAAATNKKFAKVIEKGLEARGGWFWNVRDLEGQEKKFLGRHWGKYHGDRITMTFKGVLKRTLKKDLNTLWINDIFMLTNTVWTLVHNKIKPKHTSDFLNMEVVLRQARHESPTWLSKLSNWIFYKWHDKSALDSYFRERSHMLPPPINRLYNDTRW